MLPIDATNIFDLFKSVNPESSGPVRSYMVFAEPEQSKNLDQALDIKTAPKQGKKSKFEMNFEKSETNVSKKETTMKKDSSSKNIEKDKSKKEKTSPKKELEVTNELINPIANHVIAKLESPELLEDVSLTLSMKDLLNKLENDDDLDVEDLEQLQIALLSNLQNKLDDKIENFTKAITRIDLNSEAGVQEILQISEKLDALAAIRENIQDLITESGQEPPPEHAFILDAELDLLVEARLSDLMNAVKDLKKSQNQTIQEIEAEIEENAIEPELLDSEPSNIERLINKLNASENVEVLSSEVLDKDTSQKDSNITSNENYLLELTDMEADSMMQGSHQDQPQNGKSFSFVGAIDGLSAKTNAVRAEVIKESVPMSKLPSFIADKASNAANNVKQELKLMLSPENLGDIELTLIKDGNNLEMKIVVNTKEALTNLEQKMSEIKTLLRDKGFEVKVDLESTKNESSESQNQNAQQQRHNEAEDKQKQKIVDLLPEWLYDASKGDEFISTLDKVL